MVITLISGIISGILVLIIAFIVKRCWEYIIIKKSATISKGLSLKVSRCKVTIKKGDIQDISAVDKTAAVVLPANTTFVDDCITDPNSALGSYFLKHFPEKIPKMKKVFYKALKKSRYYPNDNREYPPGTTILLPPPFNSPVNIIITAPTDRKEEVGIRAEPSSICKSIQEAFKLTSDKKIKKLYLPILGTGHGGLNIYDGLVFLLLAIKYSSSRFHHIKEINIVVREKDVDKLENIYRVQYLTLIKKEYDGAI